jgi:hypothetical protein
VWCTGQNKSVAPQKSSKAPKGLISFTPEIECDRTTMDLPPATPAVFGNHCLIILAKRGRLG